MINKPTHISGSFIAHAYVMLISCLMDELFTNATVGKIYFSDHDAVRVIIERNAVEFDTGPENIKWSGKKEGIIVFLGLFSNFNSFSSALKIAI